MIMHLLTKISISAARPQSVEEGLYRLSLRLRSNAGVNDATKEERKVPVPCETESNLKAQRVTSMIVFRRSS